MEHRDSRKNRGKTMNVMNKQLILILIMTVLTIILWIRVWKMERRNGKLGKKAWELHVYNRSKGTKEVIEIPEGCYKLGNEIWNDIKIRTTGDKVRILLHVQKKQIYFTVLKGSIRMNNYVYKPNYKEQMLLEDYARIQIGECQLQFTRAR